MPNKSRHSTGKFKIIIALVILVILLMVGLFYGVSKHSPTPKVVDLKKPSSVQADGGQVTAGGVLVPKAFQARARSLGYYCPSWDTQPGQNAPTVCTAIDK